MSKIAGRIARMAAVLLAGLLLAACTDAPLYSQLDEQQANEMMGALIGAGIQADKAPSPTKNGWEVSVARGDIPYAMQVLRSRGLPHPQYQSLGDVFKKEGFASSATEEKARYIYGLSQEISRTLSKVDGVVDARVHIALPERDPLGGTPADSSASVIIFQRPDANLADRETDFKVFVKDSIEGLDDMNKVTVKFFTVAAPPASARNAQGTLPMNMSALDPIAVAVALGVAALLALVFALRSRSRARRAQAPATPRVWNG